MADQTIIPTEILLHILLHIVLLQIVALNIVALLGEPT
jgi:hypothetical protein